MDYEINLGLQNLLEGAEIPEDTFLQNAERFILEPSELLAASRLYHFAKFPYSLAPGIYFLFHDERMVYVGKASDLSVRLKSHYRTKRFNRVSYLTGVPPMFLEDVESFYIHAATPDLNLDYPPKSLITRAMLGMIEYPAD